MIADYCHYNYNAKERKNNPRKNKILIGNLFALEIVFFTDIINVYARYIIR